jgi:hypothetical protein
VLEGSSTRRIDLGMEIPVEALGGGLFDIQGHLIGIAMRGTPGHDDVNFAFPMSFMASLSSLPSTPVPTEAWTGGNP